jgi:Skp family chaperone for outer membrane proteins
MRSWKRLNWSAGLLAAVLALHMGYTSYAVRQAAPLAPATLATVNLEQVFAGLDARAAADTRLAALAEELDGQAQAQRDEIALLEQDLEIFQPGSEEYEQTSASIAEMTLKRRAFIEYSARRIDAEQSRVLSELYDTIKEVLAALSTEYGYDIVFVDDSVVQLPRNVGEQEMMRQISARRMLYTNPAIDISQELIVRMNQR